MPWESHALNLTESVRARYSVFYDKLSQAAFLKEDTGNGCAIGGKDGALRRPRRAERRNFRSDVREFQMMNEL
jgi:hypothetical protein